MIVRARNKRLIFSAVFAGIFLIIATSIALAQDITKLVSERCSECHKPSRWDSSKKTEKQWSKIVDQMVRYGAQLTDDESTLVVEYLTAKSEGKIKKPTTTVSVPKPKPVVTTTTEDPTKLAANSVTTTTTPPTTAPPTTVAAAVIDPNNPAVPAEQAQTGVEIIWYLLGGGALIGSGMSLKNRDKES